MTGTDNPGDAADQERAAEAGAAESLETLVDQHDAVVEVSDGPTEATTGEGDTEAEEKEDAAGSHVADSKEGHDEETSSTEPAQIAKRSVTFDVPDAPCPEPPAPLGDGGEDYRAIAGQHRCCGDMTPELCLRALKKLRLYALLQADVEPAN